MPDESDFKNYKTIEEYSKTVEGTRYLHTLYLRAVNNPVRREILNIINDSQKISKTKLLKNLIDSGLVEDEYMFNYNMDFLIKAFCVNLIEDEDSGEMYYEITQSGKVIDYLK